MARPLKPQGGHMRPEPLPAYFHHERPEVVARVPASGARILDVGCAAGAMGAALLARGAAEVVGLEREHRAARIARGRLSAVYETDLDALPRLPYPDGHFDVMTFADVLEHLVEPAAVLGHLRRWLSDAGTIVCSIPNVRHESVLAPLLVEGRFEYAEAGILDRTHLRFYTLAGIRQLLEDAGFTLENSVEAVGSPASPQLGRMAEMVSMLGGDAARFKAEAQAVQYLVRARPSRTLVALGFEPTLEDARPVDPWAGSKPTRVLLAPDLANPADPWLSVLEQLTGDAGRVANVTIGLAVDPAAFDPPPAALAAVAERGHGDLLVTALPGDGAAWQRLLGGTSLFIDSAGRPSVCATARELGVEVDVVAPPRAEGPPERALYLDLVKRALLNTLYEDRSMNGSGTFEPAQREVGGDWPSQAHTMIGRKRLDNLQSCVERVLAERVPGDLIETGVWRGGATILMRAVLKAHGDVGRRVFVADSFAGLPPPNAAEYPADANDIHHTFTQLAVSVEQVQANFAKYELLDEQVVFLKGWFKDTLPGAPIEKLAVARLDGDMYESTMDALNALYPKLSVGGFLIVDDYGAVPACRKAVHDYREQHGIQEALETIDWTGVFWRRVR